jgi:membrane-associated HD superfamily phosphohydrolase
MLHNFNCIFSGKEYLEIKIRTSIILLKRKNEVTRAIVSSLVGLLILVINDSISFEIKLRFSMFIVVAILSPCFITNEKRSAIPKEQSTKRTVGIVITCEINAFRPQIDLLYMIFNFNNLFYVLSYWLEDSIVIPPVNRFTYRSNFSIEVLNKRSLRCAA